MATKTVTKTYTPPDVSTLLRDQSEALQNQDAGVDSQLDTLSKLREQPVPLDTAPLWNALSFIHGKRAPGGAGGQDITPAQKYGIELAKLENAIQGQRSKLTASDIALLKLGQQKPQATTVVVGDGAGKGAQAKPVSDSMLERISAGENSLDQLDALEKAVRDNKGIIGATGLKSILAGQNYTSFGNEDIEKLQGINQQFSLLKQTLGKALEGGVLRKEDEKKYAKIFGDIQRDPKLLEQNIGKLKKMVGTDLQRRIQNLGAGGRDVSGFGGVLERAGKLSAPAAPSGPSDDDLLNMSDEDFAKYKASLKGGE